MQLEPGVRPTGNLSHHYLPSNRMCIQAHYGTCRTSESLHLCRSDLNPSVFTWTAYLIFTALYFLSEFSVMFERLLYALKTSRSGKHTSVHDGYNTLCSQSHSPVRPILKTRKGTLVPVYSRQSRETSLICSPLGELLGLLN